MRVGFIGAGRIGGNLARLLAGSGHEVVLSFARDQEALKERAASLGNRASAGSPAEAAGCDVVVVSVPWNAIPEALEQAGSLDGRIVIDTTNQFGSMPPPSGMTAAQHNAERMAGSLYTKSFNTLTSGFQSEASGRHGPDRVAMFMCGDDASARSTVAGLIDDAGFFPADIGGIAHASVMEAPRRPGAVYGEEYRVADAEQVIKAVSADQPIPPTPSY